VKDALAPVLKNYEYVIVDTPPSLGILTVKPLVASTHLLVPIQAAYFAIEGTDDLLETYERFGRGPIRIEDAGRGDHSLRQADEYFQGYARADSRGVWRSAVQDEDREKRAAGREPGVQGNDFDICSQVTGSSGIQKAGSGGYASCLKKAGLARHAEDAA